MTDLEEQLTDMLRAKSDTFDISDDAWERTQARMNRRTPSWRPLAAVAAVAAACAAVPLALSATDPDAPPPAVPGPTPTVSRSAPQPAPSHRPTPTRSPITPSLAARQLQAFLDSWRRDGMVIASRTYLAADQQAEPAEPADVLVLSKGRVAKVMSATPSADGLVLHVELDLTFRGATGAWGNGVNERFVTFTPRTGAVPVAISLATSP
ncbi:hypothetical protein ACIBF1_07780 [Spirillospora sp. NPDC050679]